MDNTGTQTPQPPISGPLPHRPVFQPAAPAGDIILTPDATTKKSKKPWIIGGVIVVIVIIVIASAIAITGSNHSLGSLSELANKYLNYLNTGEQENTGTANISLDRLRTKVNSIYYADSADVSSESKIEYFKGAETILAELISKFDENYPQDSEQLNTLESDQDDGTKQDDNTVEASASELRARLENNKGQVETIIAFIGAEYINDSIIIAQYLAGNSLTSIKDSMTKNYSELAAVKNDNAKMYVEIQNGIFENTAAILDIYEKAGCIKDGAIVETCVAVINDEQLTSLTNANNTNETRKIELANDFLSSYLNTARGIYAVISEETTR